MCKLSDTPRVRVQAGTLSRLTFGSQSHSNHRRSKAWQMERVASVGTSDAKQGTKSPNETRPAVCPHCRPKEGAPLTVGSVVTSQGAQTVLTRLPQNGKFYIRYPSVPCPLNFTTRITPGVSPLSRQCDLRFSSDSGKSIPTFSFLQN